MFLLKTTLRLTSLAPLLFASVCWGAPSVWNGPTTAFSKVAFADQTLALNQDRMTNNVWLTRASTAGLFNIKTEAAFSHFLSPSGTAWAHGTTANYSSLTYTDWETWAGGAPNIPNIPGQPAVVHLIGDDIYLDLTFTAWGVNSGAGGSFSYTRSTAPAPEPGSLALLGLGATALISRRRR